MYFRFGTRKIVEAAATLLRAEACRRMSYLRLLKLLYIADRESLRKSARPIVGTRPVAMDYGPVLSEVLDLVNGQHADEEIWSAFIRKDGYAVALEKDPGVLSLSKYEIEMLTSTAERYRDIDDWKIVEETHTFEEWKDNISQGTSTTIALEDIIRAVGRTDDLPDILKEAKETVVLSRLVGSLS